MESLAEHKNGAPEPATAAGSAARAGWVTCGLPGPGSGAWNRRTVFVGIGMTAAAGLVLGWDWLVTVGASTLIISLLPCLLMCAFGLCARLMCKDNAEGATKPSPANADVPVATTAIAEARPGITVPGDAPVTNPAERVVPAATAAESAPNAVAAESRI